MGEPDYRFKRGDGMGGFLAPPGHVNLMWSVVEYNGTRGRVERGSWSLDSAATAEYLPEAVRTRAARMLAEQTLTESDGWVRHVYGYFRSMYSVTGEMWTNAGDLASDPTNTLRPADHHAAVIYIRQYFPDHVIRPELIADGAGGYGSYPCGKCGQAVQYEARPDALAIVRHHHKYPTAYITECAAGGAHVWAHLPAATS